MVDTARAAGRRTWRRHWEHSIRLARVDDFASARNESIRHAESRIVSPHYLRNFRTRLPAVSAFSSRVGLGLPLPKREINHVPTRYGSLRAGNLPGFIGRGKV